jgi:hypothetical protein
MHQGLHVIDQFIDGASPNWMCQRSPPAILDRSYALAQTTAKKGIVLPIDPTSLKFLQHTELTNDIMRTVLTRTHGNPHMIDLSSFCLHCSSIMPVSCELIGILASAMCAFPINLARLTTFSRLIPFFSSSLSRSLHFQTGHDYLVRCLHNGFFSLLLDSVDDLFALFPLDVGSGNGSTPKKLKTPGEGDCCFPLCYHPEILRLAFPTLLPSPLEIDTISKLQSQ